MSGTITPTVYNTQVAVPDGFWVREIVGTTSAVSAVNSVGSFRTATIATNVLYLTGYYTPGDGGEGYFYLNAADTSSSDNGGTIIIDSAGRRWYREGVNSGPISAKWFGATGNGISNDTVALQNWIALMANGGSYYLPQGTYLYASTLSFALAQNASLSLVGAGSGLTLLVCSASGDGLDITVPNPTSGYAPGAIHISGMTFRRSNIATGGNALSLLGSVGGGATNAIIQGKDVAFECTLPGTNLWSICFNGYRISQVYLERFNSEQYAIPLTFGDFITLGSGTNSSQFCAEWALSQCSVTGGRYGMNVTSPWFQGLSLDTCFFLTEVPFRWDGSASPGNGQGLSLTGCNLTGVSSSLYLRGINGVNLIGGLNQCFATGGGLTTNYNCVDLDSCSSVVLCGMGGTGAGVVSTMYLSTMISFGASSGNSSTNFSMTGCNFSAFDKLFAVQGIITSSVIAGNCGNGNAGAIIGDLSLYQYSMLGPNSWNVAIGPFSYITDKIVSSGTNPQLMFPLSNNAVQLGTGGAMWSAVYSTLFSGTTGSFTGVNATTVTATNLQGSALQVGNGSGPAQIFLYSADPRSGDASVVLGASLGTPGFSNTGTFTVFAGQTVITNIPGPYANDTAAAAAGVPVGGFYRTSSSGVQWRVS